MLDLTGLLASIGGYVGLFMGYSMLQLAMFVLEQFEMIGKRKKEDKEAKEARKAKPVNWATIEKFKENPHYRLVT